MGELTKLTKATTQRESLRTTVPRGIVKQLNLTSGDKLEWNLEIREGQFIVVVRPIKVAVRQ